MGGRFYSRQKRETLGRMIEWEKQRGKKNPGRLKKLENLKKDLYKYNTVFILEHLKNTVSPVKNVSTWSE